MILRIKAIKFNELVIFKRALLLLLYGCIVLEFFFNEIVSFQFLSILASILVLAFILVRYSLVYFKTVGSMHINHLHRYIIAIGSIHRDITNEITGFSNGGYSGEARELDLFLAGSYFRDGTQNVLILSNGETIRLYIENKNQMQIIIAELERLKDNGQTIHIKKNIRMRMPV